MGHIPSDSNLKCKVNIIPTVNKDLHFYNEIILRAGVKNF